MIGLEWLAPRSGPKPERGLRWLSNMSLGVIAYALGRLAAGAAMVSVALLAQEKGWGLFNLVSWPAWAELLLTLALLDGLIWAQHWAFHAIPWLWPLHRVHHSDAALDVTTAWRFHPGEVIVSLLVKAIGVVLFGASPAAVVAFALLLAVSAMFNHAHLRLPLWLDRVLSIAIVTPDAHRVHHGIEAGFDRTNFGFFLNVWDRVAGCYRRLDDAATDALPLGSAGFSPRERLLALLAQPVKKAKP
ncbi:MAG: sterol desaturase family protein [Pseudomonadota bacterium]